MRWPIVGLTVTVAVGLVGAECVRASTLLEPVTAFRLRHYEGDPLPDLVDTVVIRAYVSLSGSTVDQAFLEFDLAGAEEVAEATLSLTVAPSGLGDVDFDLSHYDNGTGVPDLARWDAGIEFDTLTMTYSGQVLTTDVTDLFNAALTAGDPYFGIRIHDPVNASYPVNSYVDITGHALETTLVPVPSTGLLLGAGVLLLLVAVRGRRS